MKNYKVKLRYTVEYEIDVVVVSAKSAVDAMYTASLMCDVKDFKKSNISPIATYSVSEMKEDV